MSARSAFLLLFCSFGCHASVQANANANASTDGQGDAELEAAVRSERAMAAASATKPDQPPGAVDASKRPLLGARTDLSLNATDTAGQCTCVRVALGPAKLGAFRWKGEPPSVDDQTQLVLALSSDGAGCSNPKGSLGASYWGYRRSGNDIIVYVENAVQGRPVAAGAIIPKPFGAGQVFLTPAKKGVIYGKASDGATRCKLGNPGVTRTIPVSPDEMGAGVAPANDDDLLTGR